MPAALAAVPQVVRDGYTTVRDGYDRRSLVALAGLFAVYTAVGVNWFHLLDLSRGMDWLLAGIWAFMTAVLCWDIRASRDVPLVIVAFFGGLVIEAWGTQTSLWRYFTAERPPIWILPAWPVAALTIDRIYRLLQAVVPPWRLGAVYAVGVPLFVLAMTRFLWPSIDQSWSQVVVALMIGVTLTPGDRREEVLLFTAGSLLGVFLEYWGTSRRCWTYYTGQVPPLEAIFAHGFASLAFLRGTRALGWARTRLSAGRSLAR
ncbi:hypothetical protein L6R53_12550 [Myxococcota bacterium]|nr:hypothetical protein [Myxococcota bacterium]